MFSRILDRHRGRVAAMAFQLDRDRFAEVAAKAEAFEVLWAYLDGQETRAEARDALCCLAAIGDTEAVRVPARTFWKALRVEDEDARGCLCREALQQLDRAFSRIPGHVATDDGWGHLRDRLTT